MVESIRIMLKKVFEAGADILVMGTTFFHSEDQKELVSSMHNLKRT